jgi:acyl dehydratase
MQELSLTDFELNKSFDFGFIAISEEEIIEFATAFDPLGFHTDKEIAEKSMFGALVASGPHTFNIFYKKHWLPLFKDTVLAGLEANWKYLKPIYADMKVFGKITIVDVNPNPEKNRVVVKWHFDFTNEKGELLQTLNMTMLHRMGK